MLGAIAAGVAIYGAALALAWLASGRPDGPERDLLGVAVAAPRRLRAWWRSRPRFQVEAR
jgi:hypothetical protein